jgi:dethiobiotin synthetase
MDIPRLIEDLRVQAELTDTYTYEEAADALESLLSHAKANAYEITSLRQQLTKPADEVLIEAAKAVVERWETPLWKDAPAAAKFIYRLRDAINAYKPTEG